MGFDDGMDPNLQCTQEAQRHTNHGIQRPRGLQLCPRRNHLKSTSELEQHSTGTEHTEGTPPPTKESTPGHPGCRQADHHSHIPLRATKTSTALVPEQLLVTSDHPIKFTRPLYLSTSFHPNAIQPQKRFAVSLGSSRSTHPVGVEKSAA
jgi:hypothetical protein